MRRRQACACAVLTSITAVGFGMGPALAAPPPATSMFTATDLGDLGGQDARAQHINNRGQIVGFSYLAGHAVRHAFLYEAGVMSDLETLPGALESFAFDINDAGAAVGLCDDKAVLFSSGQVIDIGSLGGTRSVAEGINASGQVVGWSYLPGNATYHGFLYANGSMNDLGTLGGWSIAPGINGSGEICGYSLRGNGSWGAFRWSDGVMTDISRQGGAFSGANEIDAAGDVVGWSGSDVANLAKARPVLYRNGTVVDLGTLGGSESSAYAMNDLGEIVGYSYLADAPGSPRHAFLYRDGTIHDLNRQISSSSSWELIAANSVNNVGRIVGYGCVNSTVVPPNGCSSGYPHAFLLTPSPSSMIDNLIDLVRSFGLPRGIENSLIVKLEHAEESLDKDHTACNLLDAFVNEVAAQAGKALTQDQADQLIGGATQIREVLGCS